MLCGTWCFTVRIIFNSDQIINTCQYGEYIMSKNNENIGAAAGSVPLEQENKVIAEYNAAAVTENKMQSVGRGKPSAEEQAAYIQEALSGDSKTMDDIGKHHHYIGFANGLTVENAKQIITEFAKACHDSPDCQAHVLCDKYVYNLIDAEAEINHKELSAEQIIADATEILEIADALNNDYSKEHDYANTRINEIMSKHVPIFQETFYQNNKKINH